MNAHRCACCVISHALFRLIFNQNGRVQNQYFRDTNRVSNNVDPDQDQRIVGFGLVQTVYKGYQR